MSSTMTRPAVTADTLNALVEFGVPFTVMPSPTDGPSLLPATVAGPDLVTLDEGSLEVRIDHRDPLFAPWTPVDGYSGQHGYRGPVMHASETLSGSMAADVLAVDEPTVYVLAEVSTITPSGDIAVEEPAGWMLLRHRSSAAATTRLGKATRELMNTLPTIGKEVGAYFTQGLVYAWGRLDQGHPPIVGFTVGERANTTDTAYGFATLYARMHQAWLDQNHPRTVAYSHHSAWERFAQTGWIDGVDA